MVLVLGGMGLTTTFCQKFLFVFSSGQSRSLQNVKKKIKLLRHCGMYNPKLPLFILRRPQQEYQQFVGKTKKLCVGHVADRPYTVLMCRSVSQLNMHIYTIELVLKHSVEIDLGCCRSWVLSVPQRSMLPGQTSLLSARYDMV